MKSIDDLRMFAISNGGKLITDKWHGTSKPYEFIFADGRKFRRLVFELRRIGWPKDLDQYFRKNNSKETKVELMAACSKIAVSNGGKFLSEEWLGSTHSHCFEHSNGTVFRLSWNQLKQRGWPKDISKFIRYQQDHLQIMRDIAKQNGGKLISDQWIDSLRKYKFQFKSGLDFEYTWNSLQIFGWPRDEDLYLRRYHPNKHLMHYLELQNIAKSKGGELLSKEYAGSITPHLFKDQAGIEFWMSAKQIKQGSWSPGVGLISEPVCRQAMIHLFGGQFRSTRKVVIRSRKLPLELDGYEDNVSLPDGHYPVAFEYQGVNSHRDDQEVIQRDEAKAAFCRANGIVLVVVDPFRVHDSWTSAYVIDHVKKAVAASFFREGLSIPDWSDDKPFEVNFKIIHLAVIKLRELAATAEHNGGKLISTEWKGRSEKYEFEFADGRRFKSNGVISHGWPKDPDYFLRTYNQQRGDILLKEIRKIVESNGGKLISTIWKTSFDKYECEFPNGRRFHIVGNTLKKNGWPKNPEAYFLSSANPDRGLEQLEQLSKIAEANSGKLISTVWIGSAAKYLFKCKEGFVFNLPADRLKNCGWPKNTKLLADRYAETAMATPYPFDDTLVEHHSTQAESIAFVVEDDQEVEITRERMVG